MRRRYDLPSLREQHAARSHSDLSDSLESGGFGVRGQREPRARRGHVLRATVVVMLAATAVSLSVFMLLSAKVALGQATDMFKTAHTTVTDSPCSHFKSDWFEVISLPKLHHGMVAPKMVSVSTTVVKSGEILELAGCEGKRIQRERYLTIGIKYQPLETWPFGRSRNIALDGEEAVCVQHAIDEFKGKITCDSV
jgi:hypothetical protein